MKKNVIGIIVSTIFLIIAIIVLGPMDYFKHGFYCDELDYEVISYDLKEPISLENVDYEMQFSPTKKHLVGFEINLINQPEDNEGMVLLTIINDKGKRIDKISVDLSKVYTAIGYKVKLNKELNRGEIYTLRFSAVNCETVPYLQTIDADYKSEETLTGDVLLGYAYAKSTFSFQSKVIICLFLISKWLWICSKFCEKKEIKKSGTTLGIIIFSIAILTWNYMYNSMESDNDFFDEFQLDSEALVTGVIQAEELHAWRDLESNYGLGQLAISLEERTDDEWLENYSRTRAAVIVNSNEHTAQYAQIGNYILFENGDTYRIIEINEENGSMVIELDANRVLNPYKYGQLFNAVYCNENQEVIAYVERPILHSYKSQYGLQGKIFEYLAKYMDYENVIANLHLICCLTVAIVFEVIVVLIAKKYDLLLAGIFFVSFWLSPWIVSFARNLYWVEFTWFIPMAIGLFCSLNIEDRKSRLISYFMTLIAIVAKCLCGYEYISTIMMGLIAFLIVDWVKAICIKDKTGSFLIFRTIFILGVMALIGFALAICIHALMRGDGSIVKGIESIIKEDVLRRVGGADMNEISSIYWGSLNTSVWDTLRAYFHFDTQIITGLDGNLFPLLCIIPLGIFAFEIQNKNVNIELMVMYVVFFVTSVSWFCLAKGHSAVHTHMNYVLWYFGFVQVCFYIIVNKVIGIIKKE